MTYYAFGWFLQDKYVLMHLAYVCTVVCLQICDYENVCILYVCMYVCTYVCMYVLNKVISSSDLANKYRNQ